MSQLILEFPLEPGAVTTEGEALMVELGNGVRLTSTVPAWVEWVNGAKLQLIMDVTGSPPDAS
jgi:hypothetical protein